MNLGPVNITKEMMPSYDDFSQNPTHLYQLKQERLQRLLGQAQIQNIQQPMPTANTANQSERWGNE